MTGGVARRSIVNCTGVGLRLVVKIKRAPHSGLESAAFIIGLGLAFGGSLGDSMMKMLLILFSIFVVGCAQLEVGQTPTPDNGQASEVPNCGGGKYSSKRLKAPWSDENTSIVIDAYEGNSINWDKMATDKRMVGVIHRSGIGLREDTLYKERRAIAKARGYLWGAYHFGYRGNVKAQADMLIKLAGDDLMILDLEDASNSKYMNLDEAVEFMAYVKEKTGKIPVVYANHTTTKQLNTKFPNSEILKASKFWYARFKSNVTDFPTGLWGGYFLWQFSSEINCTTTGSCLYNVPGTKYDMDVNVFDGSKEELTKSWHNYKHEGCSTSI